MQGGNEQGCEAERKTRVLRRLIEAPEILVMPGVYNAVSTRIVDRAGYVAGFITGSGVAEAAIGWPDVGIMGLEENLHVTRALVACTALPLLADGDTGYGNAVNVYFTVRAFEDAGAAGVMIEDQVWPKRCGHMAGKACIAAEEMVDKLRAAVEARRDPDFVIKSRTDAAGPIGLAEAIRRLQLYAEAGADLLFADALLSVDDIATVAREVPKPLAVNMGFGIRARATTPLLSARALQDLGVAVVIYPRLLTSAAIRGMQNALDALALQLRTGEVVEHDELTVSFEDLNDLVGFETVQALERRFGGPPAPARRADTVLPG